MRERSKNSAPAPVPAEGVSFAEVSHNRGIALLVVLLWTTAVFGSGITGVFVLDDMVFLENDNFQDFFGFRWLMSAYRPVGNVTLAFNRAFFGDEPTSFHVVNILIHALATACLFSLIRQTLSLKLLAEDRARANWIALVTALLWGLHPLGTSAVTYIVQRYESLASLFMLLTLLCWLQAFGKSSAEETSKSRGGIPSWLWAVTAIGCAVLAYGSKQMAAGLPLILLLYDRVFITGSWSFLKSRWPWYLLLLLPVAAGLWLVLPAMLDPSPKSTAGFDLPGISSLHYFLTQPYVFLQYLKLTLIPYPQSLDYGWLPFRETAWLVGGGLMWLLLIGLVVWLWIQSRPAAFCLLSALLVLAPSSSFLAFQDIIFEHRMYLPLAFLMAAAMTWLFAAGASSTKSDKSAKPGRSAKAKPPTSEVASWKVLLVGGLALFYSVLTVNRNLDYASRETLFAVDLQNNPGNPRAWYSMQSALPPEQIETKIRYIRRAIELSEQRDYFYAGTDYKWPRDLADLLYFSGRIAEAKPIYESILDRSYDDLQRAEIHFQLAIIASLEGDNETAEKLFQLALDSPPQLRQHVETVYQEHLRRLQSGSGGVPQQVP